MLIVRVELIDRVFGLARCRRGYNRTTSWCHVYEL